jgi:hypothetical protein
LYVPQAIHYSALLIWDTPCASHCYGNGTALPQVEAFAYLPTLFNANVSTSKLLGRIFPETVVSATKKKTPISPADVFWPVVSFATATFLECAIP